MGLKPGSNCRGLPITFWCRQQYSLHICGRRECNYDDHSEFVPWIIVMFTVTSYNSANLESIDSNKISHLVPGGISYSTVNTTSEQASSHFRRRSNWKSLYHSGKPGSQNLDNPGPCHGRTQRDLQLHRLQCP